MRRRLRTAPVAIAVLASVAALAGCGGAGSHASSGAPGPTRPIPANASPAYPGLGLSSQLATLASVRSTLFDDGYACGSLVPMKADPTLSTAICRSSGSEVELLVVSADHPGGPGALSVGIAECSAPAGIWPAGVYLVHPAGAFWTVMTGDSSVARTVGASLGVQRSGLSCSR